MSMVQQAIEVGAPLHTVYEQLAAFENYPRFMTGVQQVTCVGDRTHWVLDVDGTRREFDATITERSLDRRVSWSTMEGPRLAETLTVRPVGETRTQVVAQLEADGAFLVPGDRHGQEALDRRLRADLATFKRLLEGGAGSKHPDRGARGALASPASVAGRAARTDRATGWETGVADLGAAGANSGPAGAANSGDTPTPGRRIAGARGIRGGAAGTAPGRGASAPMSARALWDRDTPADGAEHDEDRGSS
jgi:Polyketide cyclase / dehydrase and lipid transport